MGVGTTGLRGDQGDHRPGRRRRLPERRRLRRDPLRRRPAQGQGQRSPAGKREDGPPRPRFIEVPSSGGILTDVQFRFHVASPPQPAGRPGPGPGPGPRRRPGGAASSAGSKAATGAPAPPPSASPASSRATTPSPSAPSTAAASAAPRPTTAGRSSSRRSSPSTPWSDSLEELMPGAPALQLPVRIGNPNPAPIEVTALTVTVNAGRTRLPGRSQLRGHAVERQPGGAAERPRRRLGQPADGDRHGADAGDARTADRPERLPGRHRPPRLQR